MISDSEIDFEFAIIVYLCLLNNGGDDEGTENCRTPIIQ